MTTAVSAPASRVLSARVTWIYLAAGAVPLTLIATGPPAAQTPAIVTIALGGLAALTVGLRRNAAPGARTPWRLIVTACWLFIAALVSRIVFPEASVSPPNNWALIPDAFVTPGYVLMGIGYAGMLRRRRATEDDPARVDAVLIGLAAAFLAWTFLIAPTVTRTDLTVLRLANAFFPVIDVVLLLISVQLGLAGSARKPALWLLLTSSALLFAGDFLFAVRDGQLALLPQGLLETLFMGAFLTIGATLLHPSMRTLTDPQPVEARDLGPLRIATLSAMVVVPVLIAALGPRTTPANDLIRAALLVLLVVAVLARVVRANNSRVRAERTARHRATHDSLTDLPNRELLTQTITEWGAAAAADHREISLLFIDLDRFKWVNDHWGHRVGDELLCVVAGRLSAQVRADDLVCRIGGDEFVIALAGHSQMPESLATRVLEVLTRPFDLSVGTVAISASIGVVKAAGGAEALELIRDADTAMYKAKRNGRNAYAMFDTSLRDQVRDRVSLEQALRGALGNGELAVHFQPIHELAGDELIGYEALMRWTHPELGAVSPALFIPIAEETGLIVESGAWLLRESVRQLARWTAAREPGDRQLHVSVNVAVRQLRTRALVDLVRDVLDETGLPASALWLEITESAVMEDVDTALDTLGALRDLGVVLCIDDFGTGYSSLSYLHRLPVGVVKIDRAFIAGVGGDATNEPIVRAVLAMTHAMGHVVVAEGVETAEQRDWLRAQGCDYGQGWLYGRPDPSPRPASARTLAPR